MDSTPHIRRPDWMHAAHIGSISHTFLELLRELEHCEYPSYVPLKASEELFQMRSLASSRCSDYHGWIFLTGTNLPQGAAPQLPEILVTLIDGV